ncbi:MAG TPA: OmpA family protein [Saprospiraceae bacterium]|nr:OmpA family protein [Saprospiraceae bacterium]
MIVNRKIKVRRVIALMLLVLGSIVGLKSQTYKTIKEADKKAAALYESGMKQSSERKYQEAKLSFRKAINTEPTFLDAITQLAAIYNSEKRSDSTILLLERVLSIDPKPSPRVLFTLGSNYYQAAQYDKALPLIERYMKADITNANSLERARIIKQNCEFAIEAIKHPEPFEPIKLPAEINTSEPEYLPSLSADGSTLVYSRTTDRQEDLYYSIRTNDGWSYGVQIPGINTEKYNEAGQCISADGKTLVFTGCSMPGGIGSCDLYISYLENSKWSKPKNMGAAINTRGWESQPSLSPDGNTLYFASERADGYGHTDIWVSEKGPDGNWKIAENIGSPINTPSNDGSPFIHADNQTLYFMSDGHPGMGGMDLFMSKKIGDKKWSVPVNLGYPINTIGDEGALVINAAGDTAYFTSTGKEKTLGSQGIYNTDIYLFELPKNIRPIATTYFRAVVLDSLTRKPLASHLNITGIKASRPFYSGEVGKDGTLLIPLPSDEDYGLQIFAPGYIFISEKIDVPPAINSLIPFEKVFLMDKIEDHLGKPYVMHNIYFESGSSELNTISDNELKILAQALVSDRKLKVRILGHTDNIGTEADNLKLSTERAKNVAKALGKYNIEPERILYKGYGESRPLAPNDTEVGRKINRRTEFEFLR